MLQNTTNKGGKKIRKTISGSRLIVGMPGKKPIARPASTSRIGVDIFSFLLSMKSMLTMNKSSSIKKRLSCIIRTNLNDLGKMQVNINK
jgi:hypothetical protein